MFSLRVDWEESIETLHSSSSNVVPSMMATSTESHPTIIDTLMNVVGISNQTTEATIEIVDAFLHLNDAANITTVKHVISETDEDQQRHRFVMMYAVLMAVATYVFVHRTFAFFAMCLQASINLHDHIFRGISRATMFFYNNNPSGRILNRFSKDISSIDTLIPPALMDCLAVSSKQ